MSKSRIITIDLIRKKTWNRLRDVSISLCIQLLLPGQSENHPPRDALRRQRLQRDGLRRGDLQRPDGPLRAVTQGPHMHRLVQLNSTSDLESWLPSSLCIQPIADSNVRVEIHYGLWPPFQSRAQSRSTIRISLRTTGIAAPPGSHSIRRDLDFMSQVGSAPKITDKLN